MKKFVFATVLLASTFANANCYTVRNCVEFIGPEQKCSRYEQEVVCKDEQSHSCGCYTQQTCTSYQQNADGSRTCFSTAENVVCPSTCP